MFVVLVTEGCLSGSTRRLLLYDVSAWNCVGFLQHMYVCGLLELFCCACVQGGDTSALQQAVVLRRLPDEVFTAYKMLILPLIMHKDGVEVTVETREQRVHCCTYPCHPVTLSPCTPDC